MRRRDSQGRLSTVGRIGVVFLVAMSIAFGTLVVARSAWMNRRHTDLAVFLRAGWAVRTGHDIYSVTDEHGWHYLYPPLLAIMLSPVGESPAGKSAVPFGLAVGIWYVLNVLALAWGVNTMAGTLEDHANLPRQGMPPTQRWQWWRLRALPVVVCLIGIGSNLARSQVNLFVLAMLCAMTAAVIRGHNWRAGLWLAGAVCVKVIPIFLLFYPLWRRDWRMLAGCGIGLVAGLAVIPSLVVGPTQTLAYGREWLEVMAKPAAGASDDTTRQRELFGMTTTDNQSLVAVIHNTLYADRPPEQRPLEPSLHTRLAALGIGSVFAALSLWAAGWQRRDAATEAMLVGLLLCVMLLLTPVCHLEYFCLAVLPTMVVFQLELACGGGTEPRWGWWALTGLYVVLSLLPRLGVLRDLGAAMYGGVLLWSTGCYFLWRGVRHKAAVETAPSRQVPG